MFELTEERSLIKQAVDGYFADRAAAGERGWSRAGWQRLADELGILGAPLPDDMGGMGGSLRDALIVMESLGEHLIAVPYLQSVIMAGRAIAADDGADKAGGIGDIVAGKAIVAPALFEASSRDCAHDVATRVTPTGDGGFRMCGTKIMVVAAPWASHLIVSVRTHGAQRDCDGISLFLIESDRPGIVLRPVRTIDGYACADIDFADVRVEARDRIGADGAGLAIIDAMLRDAVIGQCAEGIGLMRGMVSQTIAYAQQRRQFGQPLAGFQVLQHRLVDMRMRLEHAVSIAQAAAHAVDAGMADGDLLARAAKYAVDRALNAIGRDAIQIHGAIGMMDETPIAQYFKRATVLQLQGGSAEAHLVRFAERAGVTIPEGAANPDDFMQRISDSASRTDIAAFRDEVRNFLATQLTPDLRAATSWDTGAFATPPHGVEWHRRLAAKGWAAPSWPKEHGGPGWNARQRQIFEQEMALGGAPRLPAMGLQMSAPVIMRYGTDEQKAYFLPRILSGEDYWCQGYSEPGAGSDLAALQLRAVRDGDAYILNGSKIWTTFAQFADWIFLLVRTDSSGRKQEGITFLLARMDTPGITVRPLISISGEHEVNQVFFDDVRVPVSNRVGEENDGWRVAKYLLEFERGVGHQVPALVADLQRLRDIAQREPGADGRPLWDAPDFRRRYAALEIRTLAIRLSEERMVYALPAGQNVGDFAASLMKLSWSETAQEIDELVIEALGPYAAVDQSGAFESRDPAQAFGPGHARTPMRRYLNDRVMTIAGGSSEVQRTILAKLMLAG